MQTNLPLQAMVASVRAQVQMTRRDLEDLVPVATMPVLSLVLMAVFVQSGRRELIPYAVVAPLLMTIGHMGLFIASELVARERNAQTLELVVASPTPFYAILLPRCLLLTSIGAVGLAESWLIARLAFGESIVVHHPGLLAATVVLTVVASACTALITAALFCLVRSTRTFQSTVSYGLYLLAGVLVPVTYLPDLVEPFSRLVFLYWSAVLMRAALAPSPPDDVALGIAALAGLALVGLVAGGTLLQRMLTRLRAEGELCLA